MKKVFVAWMIAGVAGITGMAGAEVTYDYINKGSVFDGTNRVQVLVNDGGRAVNMTVSSAGGELNSNATRFGIGNDYMDGTAEILTISFDQAVDFVSIDLGGIGSDVTDGAQLVIGSLPAVNLYTGVPGFNGSTKVYTPAAPVRLNAGESIVLTGSAESASFSLEKMTFAVIPEPASLALTGLGGVLVCLIRRMARV